MADGNDTRDIVAEVREKLGKELSAITPWIVDNAITNMMRNIRRKNARLVVNGTIDLFEGHSVPSMTTKVLIDPKGRKKRVNVRTERLTKLELKQRINELRDRPPRVNKNLRQYELLCDAIEDHCGDAETVEIGLRRARGV
jgi:hypothetical protein